MQKARWSMSNRWKRSHILFVVVVVVLVVTSVVSLVVFAVVLEGKDGRKGFSVSRQGIDKEVGGNLSEGFKKSRHRALVSWCFGRWRRCLRLAGCLRDIL